MKKPDIIVTKEYPLNEDKGVNVVKIPQMDSWDIAEAYDRMAGALISMHTYLKICKQNFEDEGLDESVDYTKSKIKKVEQALEKAGVEL